MTLIIVKSGGLDAENKGRFHRNDFSDDPLGRTCIFVARGKVWGSATCHAVHVQCRRGWDKHWKSSLLFSLLHTSMSHIFICLHPFDSTSSRKYFKDTYICLTCKSLWNMTPYNQVPELLCDFFHRTKLTICYEHNAARGCTTLWRKPS
jgi:hypothetical protein